jgi:hypothetical protein
MTMSEVYEQRGIGALLLLFAVLFGFLTLQLLRIVPLLLDRVLKECQNRLDGVVAAGLTEPPGLDGDEAGGAGR